MAKRSGYTRRDIKNINVTVGLNLAAARRNAGMSQTEVMQAVWGVSNNRNRISEIENGKKDLTLIDLLIFQDLYGQSLDYICGLSTEPEIDMLAGTVNHVVNQSHALIEMLTGNVADVIVSHVKSICKNDHAALLDASKRLCSIVREDHKADNASVEAVVAASTVMRVVRSIEVKQARQAQAIDTQMMQITERVDREDRHRLLKDRDSHYQYSIPLPKPSMIEDAVVIGVNHE